MTTSDMATLDIAATGSNTRTAGSFGFGLRALSSRGVVVWPVIGMRVNRKGVCLTQTLSATGPADGLRSKAVWGS